MPLLTTLFVVGTAVFAASAVVALIVMIYLWWWQHRENPAHLVLIASLGAMVLYATLWTDYNHFLRTSDGVELSWVRAAFHILFLTLYAHMNIETVWLSWWRSWTYVALNALVGVLLLAAELAGPEHWRGWFAWMVAVLIALVIHVIAWWHMRRGDTVGQFSMLGFAAYAVLALPLTQALSYTMGQVLDHSPHRATTEILYLIITGVWLIGYGFVLVFAYQPIPRNLLAPRAAKKSEGDSPASSEAYASAQVGGQLRHRHI